MDDWFAANAPPQPQADNEDWFAQNAPTVAGQPKGGILSGIAAGLGRALNPINLVKGALDIGQPSDISQIYKYGKTLGEIVTGKSPDEAIGQNIPELQQQREAVYGKLGGREQAAALTGIGLQLGMVAAPFLHGRIAPEAGTLAETAGIAKPDIAQPSEPVATDAAAAHTETATQPPSVENLVGQVEAMPTSRWAGYDFTPEQKAEILAREAPSVPAAESVVTAPLSTETPTGEPNAIQEPSTGEVLQRQPEETGATGGERVGVEQGVQGQEPAQTLQAATPQAEVAAPQDLGGSGATPETTATGTGETPALLSNRADYVEHPGMAAATEAYSQLKPEGERTSFAELQRIDSALRNGMSPSEAATSVKDFFDAHQKASDAVQKAIDSEKIQPGQEAQDLYEKVLKSQDKNPSVPVAVEPTTAKTSPEIPVEPPTPPVTEAVPISDEQHVSTIANRFTEERTKSGELGEIAPGQGYSTKEMAAQGLKMSPEQINQHVSDLMNGTGDPIEQGKAVRAEEARLSQRSNELSRAAAADPTNVEAKLAADNAFKDVTDFHNGPVAKLKTIFHATGVGLQGELPVDLSTFNGLREQFLRDTGKAPTEAQEPQLREMAEKVSNSVKEDNGAKQNLGQAIDKATARRKLPSYDEVRQNIADRMKIEPCRT